MIKISKITNIIASLIPITVIIYAFPLKSWAKTPNQIAEMALPVTVQINSIAGGGTGVIIAEKSEGNNFVYTVLTADHVVKSAAIPYTVRSYTGQSYTVSSVEHLQKAPTDPDLAVVTFQTSNQYPTAPIGDSDQVQQGDKIAIFAYPYLDDQQRPDERLFVYSSGDINMINAKRPNGYDLLYDATTQKGMSGGPVFNQNGELIGIHGRGEKLGGEEGKYAFNAAIPINTFLRIEPEYKPNLMAQKIGENMQNTNNTGNQTVISQANNNTDIEEMGRYAGASEFYCDVSGENPRTMARNVVNNQAKVLINWLGNEQDDQYWNITAKQRCEIVSGKFQKAYYENRLNFLTNGIVNKMPVICATMETEEDCNTDNMLLTLRPNTDGQTWIEQFIKGKEQTMRPGKPQKWINMSATLSSLLDEDTN